ncbi:MAG: DUF11 domain-containing protein [Tildeniella nuda ZEHNDER 1965/U140]|nr:DUF11 domain-containing protein [Tildeniella nuda ZEHNDER 1965/U140]
MKKLPGRGFLHVLAAGVLLGGVFSSALPVVADDVVITNTASARFKDRPGGPDRAANSNPTTFTATANRSSLEIVKTADRAAAEPGDTVVYRLQIKNTGAATVAPLQVTDTLPLGLQFVNTSVRGSLATGSSATQVAIATPTVSGRTVTFAYPSLAPQQTLTLVYAALLTPDAIRGTGRNLAVALGQTATIPVQSNTASYRLQIRPGILADCGTVIGRVFVDKNFDGEQQPGEAGVPNAVIFMDDGNRITTDVNGLFSLSYVISGTRTGTLDLTSLPGYTIAPNLYRIEANSPSRLVRLAPGSTVRMNFAVTPSFNERGQR